MKNRIGLCLAILTVFSGCTMASNTPAASTKPGNALQKTNNEQYKLSFVAPGSQEKYWQDYLEGIHQADEDLNTTTSIVSASKDEQESNSIKDSLHKALLENPNGVIAVTNDPSLNEEIQLAEDMDIPLLALDGNIAQELSRFYDNSDSYSLGKQAGIQMKKLTGSEGKIGVLLSSDMSSSEKEMAEGFMDEIEDSSLEVIRSEGSDTSFDGTKTMAETLLKDHKDLKGIFVSSSCDLAGAVKAKQSKKANDVKLIGFDQNWECLTDLENGVVDSIIIESPKQIGYLTVKMMRQYLDEGEISASNYQIISQIFSGQAE